MYTLLIVDDEPLVQIGLKTMLAKDHADSVEIVGTASNGQEAWDIIKNDPPDIVIADIRMPIMTGLELLGKCHNKFGSVPAFIMLTAYEEFEMARQAIVYDAVDYLVKIELNPETLSVAITKAIRRVDKVKPEIAGIDTKSKSSLEDLRQKFMLKLFNHQIAVSRYLVEHVADRFGKPGNLSYTLSHTEYSVVRERKAVNHNVRDSAAGRFNVLFVLG